MEKFLCFYIFFREKNTDRFNFWLAVFQEDDTAKDNTHAIIPRAWIISDETCLYPKSKRSAFTMDQMVRENLPPVRKNDFIIRNIKLLIGHGIYYAVLEVFYIVYQLITYRVVSPLEEFYFRQPSNISGIAGRA